MIYLIAITALSSKVKIITAPNSAWLDSLGDRKLISYFKDSRTNLCFAVIDLNAGLVGLKPLGNVPCEKVSRLLNEQ
jgi:hypothetical protein